MPIALIISMLSVQQSSLMDHAIKANNLQITPSTPMARSRGLTSETTQSTPIFPDLTPLPRLISVKSAELMIVRPHDDDVSPRQREKNVISD